ncbi:unnamed protein product [Oncorhynchus mykiss]|uniref:DLG associated protein 4 n=1 Tax=Oncorhynchus mykiss TaxID=8022 RepID=A0A060XT70_ONCMY|nr:unnamed protein product [Oncorhynchus mykiss]
MKGLGANRSRHLSDSCEPSGAPKKPLYPLTSDAHGPFLLSPTMNHYGTLDPHQLYQGPNPQSLPSECLLPLNQMSNSSTFPRLHFTSQQEQADYSPDYSQGYMVPAGAAAKMNRLPSNLLDQLEKHLPLQRDGFSTLQFHRGRVAKQRSESPGRIRHIMHSVQKLFNKSQSLEGSVVKGIMNSTTGGGEEGTRQTRRSKSKDRAKTETLKQQPSRQNALGLWRSDNALDSDTTAKPGTIAVGYRNPLSMMTLGRAGYNTISAHTLKASKSSSDLKYLACPQALVGTRGGELVGGGGRESTLVKRGSWSTLTLSQARQVLQKGSATVNRKLLKTNSCHQDLTCQYLQIPLGDWSATLGGRGRPGGLEIPCRRMRSGSYVKAMGDVDQDSEESEGSPKPSPKTAARRQSYLKATHQSLSEQQPPPPLQNGSHQPKTSPNSPPFPCSCLPSLRELSTNRSLDNLDCLVSPGEPPMAMRHWDDGKDFHQSYSTLGRGMMSSGQVCKSTLSITQDTLHQGLKQAYQFLHLAGVVAQLALLELPVLSWFRFHRMVLLSLLFPALPTCVNSSCKKAPPPVPPRTTSKPYISVTVQSSTESAQDTYLDQQDHRGEANSQSGGSSNSSDSLCSLRTGSLAKGSKPQAPVAAPVPAPRDSHPPPSSTTTPSLPQVQPQNDTLNPGPSLTPDQSLTLPEPVPTKRKLSSIGIQVDCVQPIQREDQPPPSTKFQSIGVQVENGRPLSRASSMASRQETETEHQDSEQDVPTSENNSTVHCNSQPLDPDPTASNASASLPESLDPTLDPSFLPPPDPSLVGGNGSAQGDAAAPSTCLRDGNWFLKLLQAETARMEGWCQQMEQETKDKDISEEVMGTVRSAVGSAQLLIAQKFQQFRGLCDENLNVNANPQPTAQDLAGFWDLLQLSVEDISVKFDELWQLKANNWQLPEKEEKKPAPPVVPKKTSKPKLSPGKDRSIDSVVDKQRQEARKRLMAAKRAASVRQNSATESSDSIEIYVPEAQTRL